MEAKKSKWKKYLIIAVIVLIAIPSAEALLRLATQGNLDAPEPVLQKIEIKKEIVSNSPIDGSVIQVKEFLKKNLNDADSYESVEWEPVTKDTVRKTYYVVHKFRAKNEFGSLILTTEGFELDSTGKVIDVTEIR